MKLSDIAPILHVVHISSSICLPRNRHQKKAELFQIISRGLASMAQDKWESHALLEKQLEARNDISALQRLL